MESGEGEARTRSEYRLVMTDLEPGAAGLAVRPLVDGDRAMLADLLLDGYRGTIDDEGEGPDEALAAIDHTLTMIVREHSVVVPDPDSSGAGPIAFCSVVVVGGVHYVDPIVVAAAHKRRGIGRRAVRTVVDSLAGAGVEEVGAVITDGNTASVRLFTGLGFRRVGSWP